VHDWVLDKPSTNGISTAALVDRGTESCNLRPEDWSKAVTRNPSVGLSRICF